MVVAPKPLLTAFLPLAATIHVAYSSASTHLTSATSLPWDTLNTTLGGRLQAAVPFERPCFSIYEGKSVSADPSACTAIQSNYSDPAFRVSRFGDMLNTQWETCQSSTANNGCLLDSTNPTNPAAFMGVNCQLGNIPSYYIKVQSVEDVQAALAFANSTGVRLSVKNTGHDFKGRSSGKNTLSLWTTGFKSLSRDTAFKPEGCSSNTYDTITTGAGVSTQEVYQFADKINRTIVGGHHQTIGFSGGYFLGGGHSILSPVYGLAADRVVQVKIVTPDGVYRTANECQNQDLFFALRGGGGVAFGVVIESTHVVEKKFPLQVAYLSLNSTPSASTDLAAWYQLGVDNALQWANDGWGGHFVGPTIIYVTPLLNNTEAQTSMRAAVDFVHARNGSAVIEELPSWLAFFTKYVLPAEAPIGQESAIGTRLIPSTLFSTDEGRAQLSALIKETLSFASPYIIAGTPWLFRAQRGATSVTPAWRDAIWHLGITQALRFDDTLAEREAVYVAVSEHTQKFRALTPGSGSYFNEGDVYEPDHEQAYWGDNYAKLLAIKHKYDPDGLLDCWQCVGWKGPEDDLFQCYVGQPSPATSTD